jgi:hypothetical protein
MASPQANRFIYFGSALKQPAGGAFGELFSGILRIVFP